MDTPYVSQKHNAKAAAVFFFSNQTKSNKLFKTYFRKGSIEKSGTTLLLRINAGVMTPVNPI